MVHKSFVPDDAALRSFQHPVNAVAGANCVGQGLEGRTVRQAKVAGGERRGALS